MAALTAGMNRPGATAADLGPGGPPAARTTGPAGGDRSAAVSSGTRTVRSWPLLVRYRAEARVRSGLPAAGHLAGAAPGHVDHPARRRGGVRGVRAARLAGRRTPGQRPDTPGRPVVARLPLRARYAL